MTNYWTSQTLHEELASYYEQYRGIAAPANAFTTSLWMRIEQVEADDRARASRR